jgi:uncharacterized protein with PQ loop repeat
MQNLIGNIALNISFIVYLVLYLPQVIHNLRRKSTNGLSFLMHALLVIGYIADMMYGFGRHMQLQYRLVSVIGLICLGFQHFQIGYYQKPTANYIIATVLLLGFLGYALYAIIGPALPAHEYINAGYIAWAVGVVYTLPQVWKNYRFSSALGVSLLFIIFDIISSSCDSISAWCLNWDLPSKIGSPIEVALGFVLLIQTLYFVKKDRAIRQNQAITVTT